MILYVILRIINLFIYIINNIIKIIVGGDKWPKFSISSRENLGLILYEMGSSPIILLFHHSILQNGG